MNNSIIFLDIRTKEEYCTGHVCDAILIETPLPPLNQLHINTLQSKIKNIVKQLDKDKIIYVYCKKGIRSGIALEMLNKEGMNNVISLGGVKKGKIKTLIENNQIKMCNC